MSLLTPDPGPEHQKIAEKAKAITDILWERLDKETYDNLELLNIGMTVGASILGRSLGLAKRDVSLLLLEEVCVMIRDILDRVEDEE